MPEFIENNSILLKDRLKEFLNEADRALFALAFVRQSGVNMLIQEISQLIQRKGEVLVLFANDFGATDPDAVISLQEAGVELRFFSSETSFHLKAYLFMNGLDGKAVIGSSNLSASGLSTGIEWNISTTSNEVTFSSLLAEFNALWASPYSSPISSEIIASLSSPDASSKWKRAIAQEDRIPILSTRESSIEALDKSKNYVVRRSPDGSTTWNFNIFEGQVQRYSQRGNFNLVVICDFGTPAQKVFVIPYSYLKNNILAYANLDKHKRYLFEVNKMTFQFNWHYSIKMDGRLFLM